MRKKYYSFIYAKLLVAILGLLLFTSCSSELDGTEGLQPSFVSQNEIDSISKNECIHQFAEILSKVLHDSEEARKLIRNEALKQFDMNDDVLYYLIKDEQAGITSFRNLLIENSSEKTISMIEKKVPLINILVSSIPFFDISAQTMDVKDPDIPVGVKTDYGVVLYANGEKVDFINNGQVPDFSIVIVNENSRVETIIDNSTRSYENKLNNIVFRNSNFDKRNFDNLRRTRASNDLTVDYTSDAYGWAIRAYNVGFNREDGSDYQKAYQRDFIYYGMTPTNHQGQYNASINEYIDYIEVDPKSYYKLSDVYSKTPSDSDPTISKTNVNSEKRELTEEELINAFWTKGAYSFRFEIYKSTGTVSTSQTLSVFPQDIWEFNIKHRKKHRSFWRHSKHYYDIDVDDFTPKKYFLPKPLELGKWNIAEEGTVRHIKVVEEDSGEKIEHEDKCSFTRVVSNKITVNGKFVLGLGGILKESTISGDYEYSDVKTNNHVETIKYERTDHDDELGKVEVYFYEPIINGKKDGKYVVKEYVAGPVSFSITAR